MFRSKLRAAALHLMICLFIALLVVLLVYLGWYRDVLSSTEGIGSILLIVLAVDVVLGPLLTFVVFKVGKKSLRFDLSVIALLQVAFLGYGLYTVQIARPAFVVFIKDRFESVAVVDWPASSKLALVSAPNSHSDRALLGPKIVAVKPPDDLKVRQELMFEAVRGGPDLSHRPEYYSPFGEQTAQVIAQAQPLANLKKFNPDQSDQIRKIETEFAQRGQVGYLPLKGKQKDGVVIVDQKTGEILRMSLLKPWL
jgi:hypothetical protein